MTFNQQGFEIDSKLPKNVIGKGKVRTTEIQKSYIRAELSKAVEDKDRKEDFVKKLAVFLDTLNPNEIVDFTKLLSDDYRKNAIYSYTTNDGFKWYEVEAPIEMIYLTQTNEKESSVLETLSPPWSLKSLVDKFRKKETKGLEDFRDNGVQIDEPAIAILKKDQGSRIELIDGMHRTPSALIKSNSEVLNLYVGYEKIPSI